MTTALPRVPVVTPIIPTVARFRGSGALAPTVARHRRVPVTRLAPARRRAWTYAVAAVDDRGRIAARPLLYSLDCPPGTTVVIREQAGLLVVTADPAGVSEVSPQGHLRLAAPVRHRYSLAAGSRVLLVADTNARRLVIHPPASLDAMVAGCYTAVFGGDAA
jgi:hypothetical protein